MSFTERAVTFECAGDQLVGVIAEPAVPKQIGVLIIVGGPQYRAGSHRQFVLLARGLAAAGFPSLRFDHRGAGDSSGAMRSFEEISDDIAAAMDALCRTRSPLSRVVLWGLCDGASAALMHYAAVRDPRIAGFVLVNPWVRSETTLARAQVKHYYRARVLEREFWVKVASGEVNWSRAVSSFLRAVSGAVSGPTRKRPTSTVAFQQRMADGLRRFGGPVLLILSGRDLTAKEFLEHVARDDEWKFLLGRRAIQRRDLPEADHTCSSASGRSDLERLTIEWLADSATTDAR